MGDAFPINAEHPIDWNWPVTSVTLSASTTCQDAVISTHKRDQWEERTQIRPRRSRGLLRIWRRPRRPNRPYWDNGSSDLSTTKAGQKKNWNMNRLILSWTGCRVVSKAKKTSGPWQRKRGCGSFKQVTETRSFNTNQGDGNAFYRYHKVAYHAVMGNHVFTFRNNYRLDA